MGKKKIDFIIFLFYLIANGRRIDAGSRRRRSTSRPFASADICGSGGIDMLAPTAAWLPMSSPANIDDLAAAALPPPLRAASFLPAAGEKQMLL